MEEENWSQKQRKQIYLNYAADSMKYNVYKYTQKWVCLKSALGVDKSITDTKEIAHTGCGWTLEYRYHQPQLQLGVSIPIPIPPAVPCCCRTLQRGLETPWNLFGNRQGRLRSTFSSDSWNVSLGLFQGHLARTRVHPPGKCSQVEQMRLPPFCASILSPCPLLLHWLFSGGQDDTGTFSNRAPSRSKWTVVCFCILPIYPHSFSFRLLYLLLSRGFFSHKYSLSALDSSFCYQSHPFCPFSQQSHDLQVIYSTKIGEVLSLPPASTQFPALLMLCAQGQVKMSSTEKIFLSLW